EYRRVLFRSAAVFVLSAHAEFRDFTNHDTTGHRGREPEISSLGVSVLQIEARRNFIGHCGLVPACVRTPPPRSARTRASSAPSATRRNYFGRSVGSPISRSRFRLSRSSPAR